MTTALPSPTLSPFKRAMRTALLSSTSPVYARILVAAVWRLPSPDCTAIVSHHAPTYPNHPTTRLTMISDDAALQLAKDRVCSIYAIALRDAMSDLSERCWSANWLLDCEFTFWSCVQTGPVSYELWEVSEKDIAHLRKLSEWCGGWWRWDEKEGRAVFVRMEEWVEVVREWDAQNSALLVKKLIAERSSMTTFLDTTQGRETLRLALLLPNEERSHMSEVYGRGGSHGDPMPTDPIYAAAHSIEDPAKLAKFIVMELWTRGIGELVREDYPSPHTIDVWHDNSSPGQAITIRWWIGDGRDRGAWYMSEARTKLLAIMSTPPDESSREACMVIVRGSTRPPQTCENP